MKYAHFDPALAASPILGWYDTDIFDYGAALPDAAALVVVPDDIWVVRGLAEYAVSNGAIGLAQPDPLPGAKTRALGMLRAACAATILGGFKSSALGAPYDYPSDSTDQTNLMGSVVASTLPGLPEGWTTLFWCGDANGVWDMRPHTVAQIQQVGVDGKTLVEQCQYHCKVLSAQVVAATTVDQVTAIVWTAPQA